MLVEAVKYRAPERSGRIEEPALRFSPADAASTGQMAAIRRALEQVDAALDLPAASLTLETGTRSCLSSNPADRSAVPPVLLKTHSADLYKHWIGVSDEIARAHPEATRYWPLPTRPWSGRAVSSPSGFTHDERIDIERAGHVYLFGDSRLVADYREVIELYHGQFEAAVYFIDELTVMPASRLDVVGAPAIVVCDKLDLYESGQIALYTACHTHFGSVRKFLGATSIN
ncbi:hypothetical protein [Paraburkholderia sp. J12]|uniref:hypothetical protein n=1 Tax=Paraburkholderia sp. J12 TaxID=2805432 RepID=UPI002ABE2EA4|nr:hypothetical protein [Paraburkholderia sp. J12]